MRRFFALLLTLLLVFSVAACGDEPAPLQPVSPSPSAKPTPKPTAKPTPKPTERPAEPVLLAKPLDVDAQQGKASDLMDFLYYAQDQLDIDDENKSGGCLVRGFKGENGHAIVSNYVELLCREYGFELAGEPYYKDYGKSQFFDFALRYTGGKSGVSNTVVEGTFSKKKGAVMLYGTVERGRTKGAIWYDDGLTDADDGHRYGQSGASVAQVGESLGAGLYRLADGRYQTDDGRLTVSLGQAAVLRDGKAYTYDAKYEILTDSAQLRVTAVKNGAIHQCFYIPSSQDWESGLFPTDKFIIDSNWAVSKRGVADSFPQYTWKYMFSAIHNDDHVFPVRGLNGEMEGLSLRVMYVDDRVGVFYTCAAFESAPHTTEALIAVRMDVEPTSNKNEGGYTGENPCSACTGSGRCTRCGGSGTIRRLLAGTTEWVQQTCTSCRPSGSGNCSFCGGSGKG